MRAWLVALGIALAGVGAIAVRVVLAGNAALAAGDAAITGARGPEPAEAIAAWERAARWYLPFAPHVDAAYDRLEAVGSLAAARAIRGAALATGTHEAARRRADAIIAATLAADPRGATAIPAAERAAWHAARLAADPGTHAPLAIAGIVLWLAGLAILVARGLDGAGRLVRRPALVGAALTAIGLLGWAAGLYNA